MVKISSKNGKAPNKACKNKWCNTTKLKKLELQKSFFSASIKLIKLKISKRIINGKTLGDRVYHKQD